MCAFIVFGGLRYIWPGRVEPFELEKSPVGWAPWTDRSPPPVEHRPVDQRRSRNESLDILSLHGWSVAVGAYDGLPPALLERDLHRLADAVVRVGGSSDAMRDNYTVAVELGPRSKWRDPGDGSVAGLDGIVPWRRVANGPVPVKLIPDPAELRGAFSWIDGPRPRSVDWSAPLSEVFLESGTMGRLTLFVPGFFSWSGEVVAPGQPAIGRINARGFLMRRLGTTDRVVVGGSSGVYLERVEQSLRVGVPGGGRLVARVKTVRLNAGSYLVQVEPGATDGPGAYRFLAFPFADAWPVNRAWRDLRDRTGPASVVLSDDLPRPTEYGWSLMYVPRASPIGSDPDGDSHDESVLDPLPFPPEMPLWGDPPESQERLALPESFARVSPIISIHKGIGWEPFDETYRIEAGSSEAALRGGGLRMVVIFGNASEASIEELVRVLHDPAGGPDTP